MQQTRRHLRQASLLHLQSAAWYLLDEDDEVNEGHADKVQKVDSRSGMDQCSADESVHALQRQFAVLRSPQKGEARSSSACPPGGVLADEARPNSQNLLQLMGPDQNTQSGAASPYITASAPRQIGFGTPRPSSQLAYSGLDVGLPGA